MEKNKGVSYKLCFSVVMWPNHRKRIVHISQMVVSIFKAAQKFQ